MTRAILRISSSPAMEGEARDLVLRVWNSGQTSYQAALAVRVHFETLREPIPSLTIAQAYAANVIGRHQDALYAARQQEAQSA